MAVLEILHGDETEPSHIGRLFDDLIDGLNRCGGASSVEGILMSTSISPKPACEFRINCYVRFFNCPKINPELAVRRTIPEESLVNCLVLTSSIIWPASLKLTRRAAKEAFHEYFHLFHFTADIRFDTSEVGRNLEEDVIGLASWLTLTKQSHAVIQHQHDSNQARTIDNQILREYAND